MNREQRAERKEQREEVKETVFHCSLLLVTCSLLLLALFNAKTEEEIAKIEENGGEVMSQAIQAYRSITADEEFRHMELLREMAELDEAQAMYSAKTQGERIGEERERVKWQGVVAEKDAVIANKDAVIAELRARLDENK